MTKRTSRQHPRHARGRLEEVGRALLVGHAAQEEDDGHPGRLRDVPALDLLLLRHGVVDDAQLRGIDAVALRQHLGGVVADADTRSAASSPALLDPDDRRVGRVAAAVVLARVHVDDQRLAGRAGRGDARRVRHPVVRVDDVEVLRAREPAHDLGVARDLGHQVGAVLALELEVFGIACGDSDRVQRPLARGRLARCASDFGWGIDVPAPRPRGPGVAPRTPRRPGTAGGHCRS